MFKHSLVLLASVVAFYSCVVVSDDASDLLSHLKVYEVDVGKSFLAGQRNWRPSKKWSDLTTRLFNAPLPGGDLLVGWSDSSAEGHVSYLKKDKQKGYVLKKTVDIAGKELRGLVALGDTSFGVLAFVRNSDYTKTEMYVQKWTAMSASGTPTMSFETQLTNTDNYPQDFHIGDSRMEVDNKTGDFYAYYHVHNTGGHEGDTYFKVNSESGASTRLWKWGCSHSMSELLSYHPLLESTLAICVTDCYPGTPTSGTFANDAIGGLYTENKNMLQKMAGGCNGCVGGEVGMVAPVYDGGWIVSFTSHRNNVGKGQAACMSSYNQDVGIVFVGTDKKVSGGTIWLTNSNANKTDPALARYGAFCGKDTCSQVDQDGQTFLVGWKDGSTKNIALIDSTGAIKKGPVDASTITVAGKSISVSWGARDDSWRTLDDGSVVWLEVPNESNNILRVYMMKYGADDSSSAPASSHGSSHGSSLLPPGSSGSGLSSGVVVNPCTAIVVAIFMCLLLAF